VTLTAEQRELVERNIPLVRWMLRRMRLVRRVDPADVEAAGMLGLCEAAARYDPTRPNGFGAYARWWIRREMITEASRLAHPCHFPPLMRHAMADHPVVALDASSPDRGDAAGEARLAAELATADVDHGAAVEAAVDVELVFRHLGEDGREVLRRRYGVGCRPELLREVGLRFGVCRERVRQIEAEALEVAREAVGVS